MASLQFNLEDRSRMDNKYKKQILNIQAKIANADQRFARDEGFLLKLKERMQHIDDRRKMKEEEKNKKKKWGNNVKIWSSKYSVILFMCETVRTIQ